MESESFELPAVPLSLSGLNELIRKAKALGYAGLKDNRCGKYFQASNWGVQYLFKDAHSAAIFNEVYSSEIDPHTKDLVCSLIVNYFKF